MTDKRKEHEEEQRTEERKECLREKKRNTGTRDSHTPNMTRDATESDQPNVRRVTK